MQTKESGQNMGKISSPSERTAKLTDLDILMTGTIKYISKKKEETMFYRVKKTKCQIRCFKNENSSKVCRKFNLRGARIPDQICENTNDLNIVLKTGRKITLLNLQPEKKPELFMLFEEQNPKMSKNSFLKRLRAGCVGLVKAPIKISTGTINVLEKIGDGARKAPDVIFATKKSNISNKSVRKVPQGPAEGLLFGAESIINEVAGALFGLVAEPVKGARKKGFKGATAGLGKGIVGLIFKPVAGTIDLVTHTARGVGTMPRAIYRNVFKIKQKESKEDSKIDKRENEKNDLELVFEDDKKKVYVNKKSLNKNILDAAKYTPMEDINTACPDYKEKYEIEKEKREQLSKLVANIINGLDEAGKIKNKEFIDKALKMTESENENDNENENERKESNFDDDVSQIIDFYEGQNHMSQDIKEELYEFFFIQTASNNANNQNHRKSARLSIQTISFHDKPDENIFKEQYLTDFDSSVSSAYDSEHVMNQTISAYDSDGFDGDEFKCGEERVSYWLPAHTGREGRNGPCVGKPRKEFEVVYENILEAEQDEGVTNANQNARNREIAKGIPLFSHQSSILEPAIVSKQYLRSGISLGVEIDNVDFSKMHQLIDAEIKIKAIRKWHYPEVVVNLPYREIEDLPNVLRLQDYEVKGREYCNLKGKELADFLENWQFLENKDEARYPYTYKKGGKIPENENTAKKLKTVAKEFVMKVGRTVLSGNFNLTTIPFPIKASIPKSYLENIGYTPTSFFPLYMNMAMKTPDPLQRFKFYIVANISYFYLATPFAKPLNPIIGETLTGHYLDGSRAYLEQISHHPPISYLFYCGPKESYKFWGPSMFSAHAGLNSLSLTTKGWRKIKFSDTNQVISSTFPNEYYEGTFWGTCYTESVGTMDFVDKENHICCQITFGGVKKKPSDYFEGKIKVNGKEVSTVFGTYLGYIEIDGIRYFDYRYCLPFQMQTETSPLLSDFRYRRDFLSLKLGHLDAAQAEKDALEQLQRSDGKSRKEKLEKHTKHKGK